MDLRNKSVKLHEAGKGYKKIPVLFKLIKKWEMNGSVVPMLQSGRVKEF